MKFLIFSDNHRDRASVKKIIKKHPHMDHYISLGDSEMREQELSELNIYGVKGNYPFEPNFPMELTMEFEGVRVYLTHGHRFGVKMGLTRLMNYAVYHDIDVVCYGHTHRAFLNIVEDVVVINPGSLSSNRLFSEASYCLMEITDKAITAKIRTLKGKNLFEMKKDR